jgi:hypothetical protein
VSPGVVPALSAADAPHAGAGGEGRNDRGPRLLEARGRGLSLVESVLDDCLDEHQTVIDPIAGGERMTD